MHPKSYPFGWGVTVASRHPTLWIIQYQTNGGFAIYGKWNGTELQLGIYSGILWTITSKIGEDRRLVENL